MKRFLVVLYFCSQYQVCLTEVHILGLSYPAAALEFLLLLLSPHNHRICSNAL